MAIIPIKNIFIGLSGGIDSAVVLYIASQAFKKEKAPLFTSYAYKMASMKDQRLKKVRRENKIYKQKKSSTVTVKGF